MPRFESDFASDVPHEVRKGFRDELWKLFSANESAALRAGKGSRESGEQAIKPTLAAFIAAHPELRGKVRIRFVWP